MIEKSSRPLILHVLTTASGGGIENVVEHLSEYSISMGWRCSVAYWRGSPPVGAGATYRRLPRSRYGPTWPIHLARLFRRLEPDIVHLHGPMAGSVGAAVLRLAGSKRILYTEHSVHERRPWTLRMFRRVFSRIPNLNVAVSWAAAQSMMSACPVDAARVRVIQNGVEQRALVPRNEDGDQLTIVYVANFWPHKGHNHLVRALEQLPDRSFSVSLFGHGPEYDTILQAVVERGLTSQVNFHGHARDPWVLIRRPAIYVHPSLYEGSGLAAMEAMMCGLPVVAFASEGLLDLAKAGDCVRLVDVGKTVELAEGIRALLDAGVERIDELGMEAKRFVERAFPLDRFLSSYHSIYEELLRN